MIINLYEWEEAAFPFEESLRPGLQSYLEEAWEARPLLYTPEETEQDEEPGKPVQRFLDLKADSIKARNYVGFIQYGGVRINIEPKVFEGREELDDSNKIGLLLKWLSYSRRFHFPFLDSSFESHIRHHDWLEAFIFLFANFTEKSLSTSPFMAYQELTEETIYVKGRLAINDYVQQNLARGRHHKLYCTYEPFVYNNLFNRVVKHTCKFLSGITKATENSDLLDQVIFLLDEVDDEYCTAADCDQVKINRMYPDADRIINLCRLFLANQSYNSNVHDKNNLCVLLPMEVIFEEFVFGFMEQHFKHLQPRRQVSDMYLAKTGENFATNVFQMRHDILIPGRLIVDTKYKFRDRIDDKKAGVSQSDLYQVISYAFRRNMREVLLLYPYFREGNNEKTAFRVFPDGEDTRAVNIEAECLDVVAGTDFFEEILKDRLSKLHILFK